MQYKVFVYGTLKEGRHNHHVLGGSKKALRANVCTDDVFYMRQNGFPIIQPKDHFLEYKDEDFTRVSGELYIVDDETLARLDRLEGNGFMYQREERMVLDHHDGEHMAWMYIAVKDYWIDCPWPKSKINWQGSYEF